MRNLAVLSSLLRERDVFWICVHQGGNLKSTTTSFYWTWLWILSSANTCIDRKNEICVLNLLFTAWLVLANIATLEITTMILFILLYLNRTLWRFLFRMGGNPSQGNTWKWKAVHSHLICIALFWVLYVFHIDKEVWTGVCGGGGSNSHLKCLYCKD